MSLTVCTVSGTITDTGGNPISGMSIEACSTIPVLYSDGTFITPDKITTTTSSLGTWSLILVENVSTLNSTRISFLIPDGSNGIIRRDYSVVVPATSTATFASLTPISL